MGISRLTHKKKITFSVITIFVSFLIIEICLRVFFALYVGPDILLYGIKFHRNIIGNDQSAPPQNSATRPEAKDFLHKMGQHEWNKQRNVETPANNLEGYSKYFPHQKRNDFDVETGKRFNVTINRHGFRGQDFSVQMKPVIVRVVCLGASSTFGYFDRDNER